uniref:Uncharacterized protein n=1 Tax=Podarcis muralis TaxID=64176 RepID=A0A670JKG7_PODMU
MLPAPSPPGFLCARDWPPPNTERFKHTQASCRPIWYSPETGLPCHCSLGWGPWVPSESGRFPQWNLHGVPAHKIITTGSPRPKASGLLWKRWCWVRLERRLKPLPHSGQLWGRSPVCTQRCCCRLELRQKLRPHTSQWYGRLPEWVFRWRASLWRSQKRFPHSGHLQEGSPGWRQRCRASFERWAKLLGQAEHRYGLSLACESWCRAKADCQGNVLPQSGHGLSPVCTRWWRIR